MVKRPKLEVEWKKVELSGALFNSGEADGLIGIEECTDYNLEDFTASSREVKKRSSDNTLEDTQRKKKTPTKIREEDLQESTNGNISPSKHGSTETKHHELEDVLAWSNFGLPKSLLQALEEQGFTEPTEIQSLTLPAAVLGRRDILGAAETGSGKTLAFGLPILTGILNIKNNNSEEDEISNSESEDEELELDDRGMGCVKAVRTAGNLPIKPLYALILTPTRELAVQIKNHLVKAAKFTDIQVAVVVGGMAAVKQERILSKGPEIVVATPGRLWELYQQGNEHLSQIDNIKFLAIDETDRMLERGHFEELHEILDRINQDENKKKIRQNFVFSATLTLIHDLPKYLKHKMKRSKFIEMKPEQKLKKIIDMLGITNPKVVGVTGGSGTSNTLTECRITCSIDEKDYYVYYFLQKHPGRTLIFCNSIGCVRRLTNLLGLLGCHPLPLHASMQQRQRLKNLERFRDDENGILVATDVAARGLDIPRVEHVLHYQTPRTSEGYVHRSGRTARATRQGITVLLMEPSEFKNYIKLCRTLRKSEDLPSFPVQESYLNAVKNRVHLARELDKLELEVRKANSEAGWFQKAAEEMDIIVDEFTTKYDTKEAASFKKQAEYKRKQLTSLLSKPIFPKGFSGKFNLNENEFPTTFVQQEKVPEKAVDVMKTAMEQFRKEKKKAVPLYRPKKNQGGNNLGSKKNYSFNKNKISKRNSNKNRKQK